eukprot:m51a1_g9213 hypothetical protein (308) ;mRNA; r:31382-32746
MSLKASLALALSLLCVQSLGEPLGMIAVLYMYPSSGNDAYSKTVALADRFPVTVILNPDSGKPTCPLESAWAEAVQKIQSKQATAKYALRSVGYVATNWGKNDKAAAKAKIDTYFSCWGVSGIFFDEAATDTANLPYYKELYSYVKSKSSTATVVINPGTTTDEGYMQGACDINVIFESPVAEWPAHAMPAWSSRYPASSKSAIFVGSATAQQVVQGLALAAERGVEWVYSAADYQQLPAYWDQMVASIASTHANQTSSSSPASSKIVVTSSDDVVVPSGGGAASAAGVGWWVLGVAVSSVVVAGAV